MITYLRRARAYYIINPAMQECPSCKTSGTLMRSRSRSTFEKFFGRFTFYKVYRCKKCGWRGKLRTIAITSKSLLVIFLYILLILGVSLITHQILKRLI